MSDFVIDETPEETEERMRRAKEWIQSPEGTAAIKKAHEEADEAIRRLNQPNPRCTCRPIHRRPL